MLQADVPVVSQTRVLEIIELESEPEQITFLSDLNSQMCHTPDPKSPQLMQMVGNQTCSQHANCKKAEE